MANELSGKVTIVTGGANGIGRGSVESFVEEGARVVIADIDEKGGKALCAKLGSATRFMRTDVSEQQQVQAVVDFAVAEFGGLHVMFNNAGMSDESYGSFLEEDFSRFQQVMRVNMLGVMLGTQIAARHMAKHGGGSIINTASIAGVKAGHGFPNYRAAKAGIIHFTKSAAIELGKHMIRVNCICPGNIPTNMGTFAAQEPGKARDANERMQRAIADVRMSWQPLKRQATARDIGNTAVFLGSDRSAQMTGQILAVDGGATAGDARSQIQEIMEARVRALSG